MGGTNDKMFVKKAIPTKASQWFKHGDHPKVRSIVGTDDVFFTGMDGATLKDREKYGVIGTLESPNHLVTPGDWIVTGVKGEVWAVKPDIFDETYREYNGFEIIWGEIPKINPDDIKGLWIIDWYDCMRSCVGEYNGSKVYVNMVDECHLNLYPTIYTHKRELNREHEVERFVSYNVFEISDSEYKTLEDGFIASGKAWACDSIFSPTHQSGNEIGKDFDWENHHKWCENFKSWIKDRQPVGYFVR